MGGVEDDKSRDVEDDKSRDVENDKAGEVEKKKSLFAFNWVPTTSLVNCKSHI